MSLRGAMLNAVDLGSVPSQKGMSKGQRNTKGYYFQIQIYALYYVPRGVASVGGGAGVLHPPTVCDLVGKF